MTSCSKENINENIQIEETSILESENEYEVSVDNRAPKILVNNITPLGCCGFNWQNKRNVNITLNSLTYSFFCAGGNALIYKFYDANNPCNAPIVRSSNLLNPTFCLPGGRDYTLHICNALTGCDLDCSSGSLSIPTGIGTSSPMYNFSSDSCGGGIIIVHTGVKGK